MNQQRLEHYYQKLHELGQGLESRMSGLNDEALRSTSDDQQGNLSNTPMHLGDASSNQYDQDVATNLLGTEREIGHEVAAALDRVEQGTYGNCEDCGREISHERLDALPYARHCIECSEKRQRESS